MVSVEIEYIRSPNASVPALALQVTRLVDSYMVWVGTTEGSAADVHNVPLRGHLTRDWACAMPPKDGIPATAVSLFRSASSDVAHSMAQRLARRFSKQIFLAVDVRGTSVVMEMETRIVERLKALEDGSM